MACESRVSVRYQYLRQPKLNDHLLKEPLRNSGSISFLQWYEYSHFGKPIHYSHDSGDTLTCRQVNHKVNVDMLPWPIWHW